MISLSPHKILVLLLGICVAIGSISVGYYAYVHNSYRHGITSFSVERDMEFVLNLFEQNRYWLTNDPHSDPEHTFTYLASSKWPKDIGNLTVKLIHHRTRRAGFIAYYKETFFLGRILFVAVDKLFRSRGYAKRLIEYALQDLHARGCSKVSLTTRTINYAAQKVYTSLGFYERSRDAGYVHFDKILS